MSKDRLLGGAGLSRQRTIVTESCFTMGAKPRFTVAKNLLHPGRKSHRGAKPCFTVERNRDSPWKSGPLGPRHWPRRFTRFSARGGGNRHPTTCSAAYFYS